MLMVVYCLCVIGRQGGDRVVLKRALAAETAAETAETSSRAPTSRGWIEQEQAHPRSQMLTCALIGLPTE